MNRIRAGVVSRLQDVGMFEVTVRGERPARSPPVSSIAARLQCAPIRLRVNADAANPQLPSGACHSDGDLAPVGDQEPSEHSVPITAGCCRASSAAGSLASCGER